jgi:trans-2,3-dihydro-3-hydroxyanthranilate isomerase
MSIGRPSASIVMPNSFHIVDVFAETQYAGNQLAVVVDATGLSDEQMLRVARETNYSETTFVRPVSERDGGYCVRIFTPAQEIPFAGHPILGTAWVIRHHIALGMPDGVRLNLAVGQVLATFEHSADSSELVWFLAPPVEVGPICDSDRIAVALGLSPADIDTKAPVQQFSAGVSALIVPLRNLDTLRRTRLDLRAFSPLASEGFAHLVYAFCAETHYAENDLCARFFFVADGVREDPATGNAAAFLGVYLLNHSYFPESSLSLRIEQGYEINRPSLVMLRARKAGNSYEVRVGGQVIPAVCGELL